MVNLHVEFAVMQNRLARAAQHLTRAMEELEAIEKRMAELVKEGERGPQYA